MSQKNVIIEEPIERENSAKGEEIDNLIFDGDSDESKSEGLSN